MFWQKKNNDPFVTVWGSGKPKREFLHVDDMAAASIFVMELNKKVYQNQTKPMQSHINIGSGNNISNLNLTKLLLKIVKKRKFKIGNNVKIKFVKDRPGHDFRYALNSKKILKKLKWKSSINFESALEQTFNWYLNNYKFFENFSKKKFFKRMGLKV